MLFREGGSIEATGLQHSAGRGPKGPRYWRDCDQEKQTKNKGKKPWGAERPKRLSTKWKGDSGSLIPAVGSSALSGSAPSEKALPGKGTIGLSGTGGTGGNDKQTPAKRNRETESPLEGWSRKEQPRRGVATPLRIAVIPQFYQEDRLIKEQGKLVLASVENTNGRGTRGQLLPVLLEQLVLEGSTCVPLQNPGAREVAGGKSRRLHTLDGC